MTEQLHYDAFAELIAHQGWWFSASEIHGILTALVALNQLDKRDALLFPDPAHPPSTIADRTLQEVAAHIHSHLAGTELNFRLLLPENAALSERAEALIAWVNGFLIAKQTVNTALDEACSAFIQDLTEIARLDCDNLDNSEENRRLLNDLEEHCRLGALLLFAHSHRAAKI